MYFPLGWPKYLSVGQGQKSKLQYVVCNRYRMLFAVLTETTVSIWHCKPCVEIVCYQRCHSSVAAVGNHETAEWRQDSSMLAVSTTDGYLLLYQLEQDVRGDKGLSLYEYHQTKTNQSDSNESIPALRLSLTANVNFKVPITSLTCIHDDLLLTLRDGTLHLLSWEDSLNKRTSISFSDIFFSVDMQLAGLQLKTKAIHAVQVVYSSFLEGFGVVLSDGRAALVAFSKSEAEGRQNSEESSEKEEFVWNAKGIWAPGLNQATCLAINNKYRLLGFGTKRGDCCIYAFDDVTRSLVLSHTIALSPTHYPNICNSVGSVLKIDWSPDGCALALSWASGGFSVWSVFGACLVCTLASDRAYKADGTPVVQGVFKSMCWAVEGYHLWLVGDSLSSSEPSSDSTENDFENVSEFPAADSKIPEEKPKHRFGRFRKSNPGSTSSSENLSFDQGQLLQLQFVKSALAMNPCMSNHFHVLLHSEDKIYLSSGERQLKTLLNSPEKSRKPVRNASTNAVGLRSTQSPHKLRSNTSPRRRSVPLSPSTSLGMKFAQDEKLRAIQEDKVADDEIPVDSNDGSAVGNKQWTVIPFPINYLPSNWPIRFASVDETCSFLAIAGNFGLAHYTVISRKWKVFGNVTQEKDMVVTGGLTWWEDFVVVACYDLSERQDELRIYPRLCNLDNAFACRRKVKSQVLLVNIFRNFLILFTYDCRISIFVIARDTKLQRPMATLQSLQEIPMGRFVSYPTLVVSVTITALHMESATRRASCSTNSSRPARETEVIIVNVAGRLLLLQRSLEGEDSSGLSDEDEQRTNSPHDELKQMRFTSPVVLASCVENIWTTGHKNRAKIHLTDALWLGCGGAGVRVWLPLFPPRQKRHRSSEGNNPRGLELQLLTARRITLAFSLDTCYPLAVLFNEAVILGVTSETLLYRVYKQKRTTSRSSGDLQSSFQYSTVERTCEIYLHQILRQLLRRNLGYHALEVAATCKSLSCFPHVLELMLHEVLEEEATASEPIPDPLLPTVIKFLEEFPEYLQTVVHCARKTEIALWEYLFNSVGSPRDLFEECFKTNQLRTAASYLIILQNLEQLSVARQDATKLFDQALQNHMWGLANDIARFLRAIGDGDAIAAPRHPTLLNTNIYPAVSPAPLHSTSNDTEANFKFSDADRKKPLSRQYSLTPSYYGAVLPPSAGNLSQAKEPSSRGFPSARKLASSRSCPASPPVVVSLSGYKSSASKAQGSPTSDNPPPAPANPRRVSTRSYTESFLVPNKSNSTSSTTTATSSSLVTSSLSNSFVPRYSVRQYHQDDPVHRPLQHSLSHPVGGAVTSRLKRSLEFRLTSEKSSSPQSKEHAANECAEHYFIDVILSRQARKMLASKNLHMLGTFAAYVDFQLVPWLKKERSRAAKVDDPVACLKAMHADFDWPYPTFLVSKSNRSSMSVGDSSAHSQSFNDLQTLQKSMARSPHLTLSPKTYNSLGLKSLQQSFATKRNSTLSDNGSTLSTDDDPSSGVLTLLTPREMGSNLTLATGASEMSEVMSETSYTFDESMLTPTSDDIHGFLASGFEVDERRGPPRSEMKLQYLLELFLEARCLEWSLLICIMLKDPSYMARLLRSCEEENLVPLDTLQRTRDCLQRIDEWAIAECSGYKAVLVSCRAHVHALYDLTNAREVTHAEKEAIKANQHQQIGMSQSVSDVERHVKLPKSNSISSTQFISIQGSAKKQLFEAAEDKAASSEYDDDVDISPIRRQGSLETRRRPNSLRTRHNSVPCNPDASTPAISGAIHAATPSPEEVDLGVAPIDEARLKPPVKVVEDVYDSPHEGVADTSIPKASESQSTDSDRFSSTSGSADDEGSGCAIS